MFKLPTVDFSKNAFLDAETIEFHFGKHHKAYIDNLNKLTLDSEKRSLIEIIKNSQGALFNNAAQSFNHTFYWLGLTPDKNSIKKESNLSLQIDKDFGGIEKLKMLFLERALSVFGSGWTWLALNKSNNQLEIINTPNADVIDFENYMPLLLCDVWEHAYYIDYRNSRANYLNDFWDSINWNFVSENFEKKDLKKIENSMSE